MFKVGHIPDIKGCDPDWFLSCRYKPNERMLLRESVRNCESSKERKGRTRTVRVLKRGKVGLVVAGTAAAATAASSQVGLRSCTATPLLLMAPQLHNSDQLGRASKRQEVRTCVV